MAIDHLRGRVTATALLRQLMSEGHELLASELVRFELLSGVKPAERGQLEQFFSALIWIPVDEPVARAAAGLARNYKAAFSGIDTADYIIAATAVLLDAPLLTTNVRHFPMLEGLEPAYRE